MSIRPAEYASRRQHLMSQMAANSIAILPASPVCNRNNSVDYPTARTVTLLSVRL